MVTMSPVVTLLSIWPQPGGVGFVTARHAALSTLNPALHGDRQARPALPAAQPALHTVNASLICVLQSSPHVAGAGGPMRLAPQPSSANPTAIPVFIMALPFCAPYLRESIGSPTG